MLVQTWMIQVVLRFLAAKPTLTVLLGFFSVQVLERALQVWGLR